MNEFDRTTRFMNAMAVSACSLVTIFDGVSAPKTLDLNAYGKGYIYFGRAEGNDIVITSTLVSAQHGRFANKGGVWVIEDKALYSDKPSTNGLIHNDANILSRSLTDGDFIRIDDGVETVAEGVLFVFSSKDTPHKWYSVPTMGRPELTIGRDAGCSIVLPHVSVSKCHARILYTHEGFFITDNGSTNGIIVNNKRVYGKQLLHEKDVIAITNSKIIFTRNAVYYCCYRNGISVDASNVVITRGSGAKSFVTCNHTSVSIRPGELVAIIGGSGAGKSTLLNAMCGYLPPSEGNVFINGINLYQNFDSLKKLIGYVPQSDIVYDNLTLHDMLLYTAKLRLPQDTQPAEMEAAIARAIATVELTEKRDSYIKALSGGQRKRASIAVELLSDPNLLFLDEPASGLDPGTERNLMKSLRTMADGGKTIILVTHSTLQLKLCDKIIFMGRGGNLCFCGSQDEALKFFGVGDVVDIYNMITDNALYWRAQFEKTRTPIRPRAAERVTPSRSSDSMTHQLGVLSSRYLKLIINDKQRLLLLLIQAPLLAILISFVANGTQFEQKEMTKSLLFALSCSAFWVGMLNAIQEICKERTVLKREYMTGLSLTAYTSSKIIVLGCMCFIQSLMITIVFGMLVGTPDSGVLFGSFIEMFITTFLTAVASTSMGLFVSSLFTNADRAMTVAPILLMPQILFSGMIFKLSGATEVISWFAVCRWSMESFGTTADLNDLPSKMVEELEGVPGIEKMLEDTEAFYEHSAGHLMGDWFILILFTVGFLVAARIVLSKLSKEKS